MEQILKQKSVWVLSLILGLLITSCRKSELITNVSDQVNMTTYIDSHPEQFSELSKILKKSGTASFLNAYGSYTFFAPNNQAIASYLKSKGKSSVDDLDNDEWRNFIRFHLLEDSIATAQFTDGKLPQLTMYGQYLVTGAENVGGQTKIKINKQAYVVESNISVGNGLIHVIDAPLEPASLSLAKAIEQIPNLGIFTEALKATGIFDDLDKLPANNADDKKKWLTVLAESDQVLAASGINNFQDLKDRYSNTGDPTQETDSLYLFMNYHILYDAKYIADIISVSAHPTLVPLEVITAKLSGEKALINDDIFNGVHEPGIELLRGESDLSCTNGVLHFVQTHFSIKKRSPFRVDFDVCTFPEMVKNREYYGKQSYAFSKEQALSLSEVKFSGSIQEGSLSTNVGLIYRHGSAGTSKNSYNMDVLVVPLDPVGTSNRPKWVEFKTPLLIKGKYRVWVGYYTQAQSSSNGGTNVIAEASIGFETSDERVPLASGRTLSFSTKRPGQPADTEEAIGWKTYMENTAGSQVSRNMGIAEITQTGRYWLRIEAVGLGPNGSQNTNNIDLIQFIPINDDQQYPKFKVNGDLILRP